MEDLRNGSSWGCSGNSGSRSSSARSCEAGSREGRKQKADHEAVDDLRLARQAEPRQELAAGRVSTAQQHAVSLQTYQEKEGEKGYRRA